MASIVYKSLSALSPIELKYDYYREEELQSSLQTYADGRSFYKVDGLTNYQDLAINRESCFVLTTAVNLSSIFTSTKDVTLGELPASIVLMPRTIGGVNNITSYVEYNEATNNFTVTSTTIIALTSNSILFIKPIQETGEVELRLNGKFVQVQKDYPYEVNLNVRSLELEDISRQRFQIVYQNGLITLKTKTQEGYRYLALGNDYILRATGLILNDSIINDYVFKCIPVTDDVLARGFISANTWTTYYFDIESSVNNKNVKINKDITPTETNLLIDFPTEKAAETGVAHINAANLKTAVTPSGGPAPIENAYTKEVITTN
jgi:hypothetical protein